MIGFLVPLYCRIHFNTGNSSKTGVMIQLDLDLYQCGRICYVGVPVATNLITGYFI